MADQGVPRWLVIMAREPRAGAVKRRLAAGVGAVEATRLYRALLRHVVRRLGADRRWRTLLAITPDTALLSGAWPAGVARCAQGRGDLGVRMQRLMRRLPPGPAVIVGSDIATVAPAHVARAFAALGRCDAVLGPARDGGYWLVGLKRVPRVPRPFKPVRWSSEHAFADTYANLRGRNVATVDMLSDIDSEADYRRLRSAAARLVLPPSLRAGRI